MFKIDAAMDRISEWFGSVAMAMALTMMGITIFEVVARRFFDAPTIWSNDMIYMLNGSLFILGGASTLLHCRHVTIDIFVSGLNARVRHCILGGIFGFLLVPAFGLIGFIAFRKTVAAFLSGETETVSAWEPLLWPYLLTIAVGLFALTMQLLTQSIRHLIRVFVGGDLANVYVMNETTPSFEPESDQ